MDVEKTTREIRFWLNFVKNHQEELKQYSECEQDEGPSDDRWENEKSKNKISDMIVWKPSFVLMAFSYAPSYIEYSVLQDYDDTLQNMPEATYARKLLEEYEIEFFSDLEDLLESSEEDEDLQEKFNLIDEDEDEYSLRYLFGISTKEAIIRSMINMGCYDPNQDMALTLLNVSECHVAFQNGYGGETGDYYCAESFKKEISKDLGPYSVLLEEVDALYKNALLIFFQRFAYDFTMADVERMLLEMKKNCGISSDDKMFVYWDIKNFYYTSNDHTNNGGSDTIIRILCSLADNLDYAYKAYCKDKAAEKTDLVAS